MKKTYHLGATAAFGLEGVVANELKRMGFDAKGFHGGATFDGTLEDAFEPTSGCAPLTACCSTSADSRR